MQPLLAIPVYPTPIVSGLSGPVWLDENGIAMVVFGNETSHTIHHAKSQLRAFEKIAGGKLRPLLADFTNSRSMSKDAREFYMGLKSEPGISALASKVGFLVANFFASVNLQSKIPICICKDTHTAIKWLKRFSHH